MSDRALSASIRTGVKRTTCADARRLGLVASVPHTLAAQASAMQQHLGPLRRVYTRLWACRLGHPS